MSAEVHEDEILRAVQDYQSALEAGHRPSRQAFLAARPDLAPDLGPYLEALDALQLAGARGTDHSRSGPQGTPSPRIPGTEAARPAFDDPFAMPLGDYHLLRELGRGGMGVVYEAVQLSLGRLVALKVLPFAAALDNRQLQRFKNEAQAAAQLHHTNIVPVYAVGCERSVHFYAMQLIHGQTVAELVAELRGESGRDLQASGGLLRKKPSEARTVPEPKSASGDVPPPPADGGTSAISLLAFTRADAARSRTDATANVSATAEASLGRGHEYYRNVARLMLQAAEALEHAHQQGVIHRDIKPANLLVDVRGHLWVTDFGLALIQTGADLTRTGDLLGTLRYMSPEQASGQRVLLDQRTDLYSLGASFYELLALEPVFEGHNRGELLHRIANEEPRRPSLRRKGVPIELETIVLKCLSKSPADRYPSAHELAEDLKRFLDNKPIHARPPSWVERGRKWLKRHPGVTITVGIILLLSTVGLLVNHTLIAREQALTAAALKGEQLRAAQAERRLQQAQQLVTLLIQVGAEELDDRPSLQGLRKRLLETALTHYKKLVDESADNPTAAAGLAAAHDRVRQVLADVTTLREAEALYLLSNGDILTELKLDEEQRERVEEFVARLHQQRLATAFNGELDSAQRRQKHLEHVRAAEQEASEVLGSAQRRRLKQIAVQLKGMLSFKDPDVVATLGLTPDQCKQIHKIERESMKPEPSTSRPGRFRLSDEAFRKGLERCLALLTTEQRRIWDDLTGPPFTHRGWLIPPGLFGPARQ